MVCTFFGHRDTPPNIARVLRETLIHLIENEQVDLFYVGNQGSFDCMVKKTLELLKHAYPQIAYTVVLAYMPNKKTLYRHDGECFNTMYPEGMENTLPQYAIIKRNRWMIDKSDYVVTYVTHTFGGAAQFKELAEKKGKVVINLAELE